MREFAHTLLVLLALAGLAVPKAVGQPHDVACNSATPCPDTLATPCTGADHCHEPCDGCPPLEQCPCPHPEDSPGNAPSPLRDNPEDDPAPAPEHHHHHHHHHQCLCSAGAGWLIADSEPISLHPPRLERALAVREFLRAPDSPVFLLDRPPMA